MAARRSRRCSSGVPGSPDFKSGFSVDFLGALGACGFMVWTLLHPGTTPPRISGQAAISCRSAELVDHRRFGITRYPPFQLLDWDQALPPSPDNPQFRRDLLIEEIRTYADRGCRLGWSQHDARNCGRELLRHSYAAAFSSSDSSGAVEARRALDNFSAASTRGT